MRQLVDQSPEYINDEDTWINEEAAVELSRREHDLSKGAALNLVGEVLASGNVQRRGRLKHQLLSKQFDQDFGPIPSCPDWLWDSLMADIELNLADFRAESRVQLGKPAMPAPQRRYQERTAASERADKGGRPPIVRAAVTEWFYELPDDRRALSATKLAESYCLEEKPPRLGSEGAVRKIISRLKDG
jgi:hypothetical protein